MWKAVEASTREIRVGKAKGRRKEERSRKKERRKREDE